MIVKLKISNCTIHNYVKLTRPWENYAIETQLRPRILFRRKTSTVPDERNLVGKAVEFARLRREVEKHSEVKRIRYFTVTRYVPAFVVKPVKPYIAKPGRARSPSAPPSPASSFTNFIPSRLINDLLVNSLT